ncbi:MAG: winged helix-turn-helix domain-containing protein [Planctomycetes bacterium]|nr:winged helix-turn-helix domain-containing protein [Planctomycetota bacterium]
MCCGWSRAPTNPSRPPGPRSWSGSRPPGAERSSSGTTRTAPDARIDGRRDNGADPELTAEQQAELFTALQAEPPDRGLWSGPKVAAFVKDRFGVEVWPQTGWPWLKDLGFRLVVPRPRHPKAATPAEQQGSPPTRSRPARSASRLLGRRPGVRPPGRHPLRLPLPGRGRGVPPGHEEPVPSGDPEREPGGPEVPVGGPHVVLGHCPQDGIEPGPLLGVPVLARDHVDGRPEGRVEEHPRRPR